MIKNILAATLVAMLAVVAPALAEQTDTNLHGSLTVGDVSEANLVKNQTNVLDAKLTLDKAVTSRVSLFASATGNLVNTSVSQVVPATRYTALTWDGGATYRVSSATSASVGVGTTLNDDVVPGERLTNKFVGVSLTTRLF